MVSNSAWQLRYIVGYSIFWGGCWLAFPHIHAELLLLHTFETSKKVTSHFSFIATAALSYIGWGYARLCIGRHGICACEFGSSRYNR